MYPTRTPARRLPLRLLGAAGALALLTAAPAARAGVKLITLPPRERVEIQLDHGAVTLVEEERFVPLKAGANDVVFAWTNTQIDPASIQLRCLTDPERVRVLSVSYPPEGNQLTWQVSSPAAGTARVRISYVIGQLDKTFAYKAIATHDEKTLTLWQYLQLHNSAAEAFGEAGMSLGFGERLERPIGASENERLQSARFLEVPIEKRYTADLSSFGYLDAGKRQLRVPMHYVLANTEAGGLGRFPMMPGKARIFQNDGRGGAAFLGEDWAPYTPRGEEMALYLGVAKDIAITRTIDRNERQPQTGRLYHQEVVIKYEIENFKDTPVVLDLAESIALVRGETIGNTGRPVEWALLPGGTLDDIDLDRSAGDRVLFHVALPARGDDQKAKKVVHTLHVLIKNEW